MKKRQHTKMKKLILLCSLLLASCSATINPANFAPVTSAQAMAIQATQPTATATLVPTATINAQATMALIQQAQQDNNNTAIALQMIIIAPTQTKEANDVLMAQANAAKAQADFDAAALSYQAQMTHEAFVKSNNETSVPLTQRAYQTNVPMIQTAMMATIEAPARLQQMNAAKWDSQWGWLVPVLALASVVFFFGLLIYMFWRLPASTEAQTATENQYYVKPLSDLIPIPMAQKDNEPGTTQKAVIPCTWPRLEVLAKGIIQDGKTLAKNQWEGTIVHRSIDSLRAYFLLHEFAYELPGKRGELGILETGNHFFMYCVENGEPPSPHVCETLPSPTA